MTKLITRRDFLILLAFFVLAFLLRVWPVWLNNVSFHFDMSRDAFTIEQIWKYHHLKLLGPPSSGAGLFHGVLYYYLLAPFYALGQGNPVFPSVFLILINCLTIIPLFLLGKDFFKSSFWGYFLAGLFVLSFEAAQYAPWLSNPGPAVFTTAWFFYGLYLWIEKKPKGFILAMIAAAFSVQFQLFLLYFFILLGAAFFIFHPKLLKRDLIISSLLVVAILSSMVIAVFKFGGPSQLIHGFTPYSSTQTTLDANFTDLLLAYFNNLAKVFTNNLIPVNVFLGGILSIAVVVWLFLKKQSFILVGIFSSVIMFFFGGHSNAYANIGLVPMVFLGFTYFVKSLYQTNRLMIIGLVVVVGLTNFYMVVKSVPQGQFLMVIQPDMTLRNQLALVDQTYQTAQGRPFSINSLTVPLWTDTTWAYLYHYYGQKKYGYVPTFYGNDPVGTLGADIVGKAQIPTQLKFFIIEPLRGIPGNISDSEMEKENGNTHLIKEYNYGELRLQQRESNNASPSSQEKRD